MITDKLNLGDRTPDESRGLGTFICLLPHCKASFMDDEALSLHLGTHLDMMPSATDGTLDMITNELSSLQKAMDAIREIIRQYKHIGSRERENMKTSLRHLYVALDELRDFAERQDSNSGYTSSGVGDEEGTQANKSSRIAFSLMEIGEESYASSEGYKGNLLSCLLQHRDESLLPYMSQRQDQSVVDKCRAFSNVSQKQQESQVHKWSPLCYASFLALERGLVKAAERARLKIDGSMTSDLEWCNLEKHSQSASRIHGLGGGVRSVANHISLSWFCERSYGQELGVLDLSCLILGKLLWPPLQWLSLQSLQVDLSSTLDQSILNLFPFVHQLMSTLSRHNAVSLSMSLVSTILTVLALFIPFSHIGERCRSQVLVCCWIALVVSGPFWTYIGGSAASFFLVFMPYTLSVGISIGHLWYRCVSKRGCQIPTTQEELNKRAASSDNAN